MLAVLTLSALAGFEAVMPLPLAAQTLSSVRQAASRLFEIVDAEPAVSDQPVSGQSIRAISVQWSMVRRPRSGLTPIPSILPAELFLPRQPSARSAGN